jgi:hypothetical protein
MNPPGSTRRLAAKMRVKCMFAANKQVYSAGGGRQAKPGGGRCYLECESIA